MLRSLPFRWQPDTVTQEQVFQAMGMTIENLGYDRRLVFDQLVKVKGIVVSYCAELEELNFPVLEEVIAEGAIGIRRNDKLTKILFPKLETLSPGLQIAWCPVLTTIAFPELVTWGGQSYDFSGNALSAETVNQILARMVAYPDFGPGRSVDLTGGTNAAPTGQGATDKATLIARGNFVETN